MECAVLFGGAGFIGTTFARFLIDNKKFDKIYICDDKIKNITNYAYRDRILRESQIVEYCSINTVTDLKKFQPHGTISLVVNLAAVHREPGHRREEYYETNILSAEAICSWCEINNCNNLIFTSSISVYGPSDTEKHENSVPMPATAYGMSKLAAENIHLMWSLKDPVSRRLVIIRPGVVFGATEDGNVTRMIKAVRKGYFFFCGNQNKIKAGIYVKDLCSMMIWALDRVKKNKVNSETYNAVLYDMPTILNYFNAINTTLNIRRRVININFIILLSIAYLLSTIAFVLRVSNPIHPTRVKKLLSSNKISSAKAINDGFNFSFTLESAFADWRIECPDDW